MWLRRHPFELGGFCVLTTADSEVDVVASEYIGRTVTSATVRSKAMTLLLMIYYLLLIQLFVKFCIRFFFFVFFCNCIFYGSKGSNIYRGGGGCNFLFYYLFFWGGGGVGVLSVHSNFAIISLKKWELVALL